MEYSRMNSVRDVTVALRRVKLPQCQTVAETEASEQARKEELAEYANGKENDLA